MKILLKKSFAVIMALVICTSVLFGLSFSAQAATVNYNTASNGYVYNWGQRGTVATFLSPMATAFYSKNSTSLDALLALNGSSSESSVPSSTLYKTLHNLMESNQDYVTSYSATKNLFMYTDCQNNGGKISSFYSGKEIGPSWDGGWNREHTWPNSKGDKAGSGENDLMMLRPTSSSENSSRGNKAYGTTTNASYYNPNDESGGKYDLRGDVARIVLYVYVRWECTNTGSKYNSTGIFGTNGVIESKAVLLDWIEQDPVDTWELGRNDAAESILGTRNVFVDYPELAFDLFNVNVPANYTSPSGGTGSEGGDNAGTTEPETPEQPETPEEPETPVQPETPTTPSGSYYQKVTSAPSDWSGNYLIVYEGGNLAFDGGLTSLDVVKKGLPVTIDNSTIAATDATNAAKFTIEKSGNNYTIKSASGYYIGNTSNSKNQLLSSNSTKYTNTISLNNDGSAHIVASSGAVLRFNAASDQMRFRYFKPSTYTSQKAVALYKYVEAPAPTLSGEIAGAQVSIGADLSVDFYANIENLGDNEPQMKFTFGDDDAVVVTEYDTIDGKYVFTFDSIAPQRMSDIIKAELIIDGDVFDTVSDYSIKQNAQNLLAASPGTELKQFITDMLYYGAAAQKYRGYNVNNLANSGVTNIGTPSTALPTSTEFYLSNSTGNASFKSATVYFDTVNRLVVKVNNFAGITLKVNGAEVAITDSGYRTEGIKATAFDEVYEFEIFENGKLIQTLEYSVNSYAHSKQNSQSMGELALSLYRYGISAKAYAELQ